MNKTDPTGLWGKKIHRNFTFTSLMWIQATSKSKILYPLEARTSLLAGCVRPDQKRKGVRQWHGHEGIKKMKKRQLSKAKDLWRQKRRIKAYTLIGEILHSMQDFYAHNVFYEGKYVDSRSTPDRGKSYFAHKKIEVGASGVITWGLSGKYLDNAFLDACRTRYDLLEGVKVHSFTADNINADFVKVGRNYKWVWVNDEKANPRYKNAMDDTMSFLE